MDVTLAEYRAARDAMRGDVTDVTSWSYRIEQANLADEVVRRQPFNASVMRKGDAGPNDLVMVVPPAGPERRAWFRALRSLLEDRG